LDSDVEEDIIKPRMPDKTAEILLREYLEGRG
jgi:hypothetical protein